MNALMTSITPGPRRHRRAGFALGILLLAAGCSRGGHDQTKTRYGSADTSRTARPPAASEQATPPSPREEASPPPQEQMVVVPAGSRIVGALQAGISTENARTGDKVSLRTIEPVTVNGRVAIPAGTTVNGEVTYAKGAGRIGGAPELTVRFHELVTPNSQRFPLAAEPFRVKGKDDRGESLKEFGGGVAAGAAVGALLGKGEGALKGAAIGGIIGTGVAVATKGHQIVLPEGQGLSLTLTTPLTLPAGR